MKRIVIALLLGVVSLTVTKPISADVLAASQRPVQMDPDARTRAFRAEWWAFAVGGYIISTFWDW